MLTLFPSELIDFIVSQVRPFNCNPRDPGFLFDDISHCMNAQCAFVPMAGALDPWVVVCHSEENPLFTQDQRRAGANYLVPFGYQKGIHLVDKS